MVIIQEGTVRVLIPEAKDSLVSPAIQKIKALVPNENCRFILFHTWASNGSKYPKDYCCSSFLITKKLDGPKYCSKNITSLAQEVFLIDEAYTAVVKSNNIEKSNNGNIAYDFEKNHPEIKIYDDDQHPSLAGAFLNACVFYEMLTGKKAKNLKFNGSLNPTTSQNIKNSI